MTSTSIKNLKPRLEPLFGILTASEDEKIRKIFDATDEILLEFANFFGSNRAGSEGTGLELNWYPSGQINISTYVATGINDEAVSFSISLYPGWFYENFPKQHNWKIEAEIYADCRHSIYCGSMHCVYELPAVICNNPVDSAMELHKMTKELVKIGKEKQIKDWLQLAEENQP